MKRVYDLLEGHSRLSRIINSLIAGLIVLNVISVVLESYQGIEEKYSTLFYKFEIFSMTVFSIEYISRLISAPYKYSNTYKPIYLLRYFFSALAIIDLISVLPFYLPLVFRMDLRFIRIIRVFRLIRILKIKRYSKSLDIIVKVLRKKKTDLILTMVIISILLFMSGSIIYYAENDVQPNVFPNILDSAYWALKTMVFLGYDSPPLTIVGKIVGIMTTILGLGWIAMPISIISSGFIEEIDSKKEKKKVKCPDCGKEIEIGD